MKKINQFILILVSILSLEPALNAQNSELSIYWQKELDSIGIIHNKALSYAYNRLQTADLANLSQNNIAELTATYCSEFYTDRYGAVLNFNQNELKSEILNIGITPPDHNSLGVSTQLKESVSSMLSALQNLDQTKSPEDFEIMITNITNEKLVGLSENEKTYLIAYKDLLTKSFSYWDQNIGNWTQLFDNQSARINLNLSQNDQSLAKYMDYNLEGIEGFIDPNITSKQIYLLSNNNSSILKKNMKRHPCAIAVASADGGGLFSGLVRGCIVGVLFGAGVGCIPAAIFWGGVQGVSSSLGAGIACLAMTL